MKKTITALSLAAALLLSGCSGVSQESGNSATDESSSSQTESSSSSTATSSSTTETSNDTNSDSEIYSQTEIDNIESEQSTPTTSETNDPKQVFLTKSKDLLSHYIASKEISKLDDSDSYYALYLSSWYDDTYCDAHFMFYTDDIDTICNRLSQEVQQLTEYYDNYDIWYTVYANDKDNNHIVTIGNWTPQMSGNKLSLMLCWDNAEMQEKYKQMESDDLFKDFTIKVIN